MVLLTSSLQPSVGDEANRLIGERVENRGLVAWAGVDHFSGFGQGIGHVPIGDGVLARAGCG